MLFIFGLKTRRSGKLLVGQHADTGHHEIRRQFGAIVQLLPGKDGLLHISEVRKLAGGKRVENVEDVLSVGQKVLVKITKIDDRGKLSLEPVLEGDDATAESGNDDE